MVNPIPNLISIGEVFEREEHEDFVVKEAERLEEMRLEEEMEKEVGDGLDQMVMDLLDAPEEILEDEDESEGGSGGKKTGPMKIVAK